MTWREALVMLLLGVVVGVAGMVWYMQSADSKWTEREKELVEDSARFQRLAKVHGDSANEAIVKANAAQREADEAIAELEEYKKRRRGRPMPTNLKDCKEELEDYSAEAAVAERALAYTRVTNDHLRVTVSEQRGQILALGSALTAEHERGDGWKRHSKRARVKQAFFGIGMAGAGVLVGWGGASLAAR